MSKTPFRVFEGMSWARLAALSCNHFGRPSFLAASRPNVPKMSAADLVPGFIARIRLIRSSYSGVSIQSMFGAGDDLGPGRSGGGVGIGTGETDGFHIGGAGGVVGEELGACFADGSSFGIGKKLRRCRSTSTRRLGVSLLRV